MIATSYQLDPEQLGKWSVYIHSLRGDDLQWLMDNTSCCGISSAQALFDTETDAMLCYMRFKK